MRIHVLPVVREADYGKRGTEMSQIGTLMDVMRDMKNGVYDYTNDGNAPIAARAVRISCPYRTGK